MGTAVILVSVARSWPQATTDQDRLDAVEGVWPLHSDPAAVDAVAFLRNMTPKGGSNTKIERAAAVRALPDVPSGAEHEMSDLFDHDDYLLAVLKNEVVAVRHIDETFLMGGKVVFATSPAPEVASAIGRRLPDNLAWKRGEAWPLKAADSEWLEQVSAARTATLGAYRLTLAPNGSLHVSAPDGGAVVVSGAGGFTPDQALAPVPLRTGQTTSGFSGDTSPDYDLIDETEAREAREEYELEQAAATARARAVALFAAAGIDDVAFPSDDGEEL